jgi:predicted  nucleic acid-binding Zn-ribbon protein
MIDVMEEIRSANSQLREWGNDECKMKESFEKERDEFEGEIKDLKSEIEDLKSQIEELERQNIEA